MLADLTNAGLVRALRLLPPEVAHRVAIAGLRHGLAPAVRQPASPRLATTLFGRSLPHPLGLAAGFDKNAEAVDGLLGLGFAFVEVGTVTPQPQAGNPRPRLFRLPEDRALINRLGFNNAGLEAVRARLAARGERAGLVGVNIGMNRDAADPIADYVTAFQGLYAVADYLTVNVSSPNTPGLRALQGGEWLRPLLDALVRARNGLADGAPPKPLLVKIAPDLDAEEAAEIAAVAPEKGVDGLIISNTTLARPPSLSGRHRDESGGLSGPPLFARSTALLRRMYRLTDGRVPLIGVGGIEDGATAYAKIRAGATALQLYTAFVHQGPAVVGRVLGELDALLARDGVVRLADAVGVDA